MKLSKLILTTLAAAAVIGFAGCKGDDEDQHGILKIKGDTASVDYTNESNITYRGFKTLKTKHTDAVAVFTLGNAEQTDEPRTGVFGFVFDLQKNKDATNAEGKKVTVYDFTAVSLRKNGNDVQCYVSRFEGVDPDKMDGGNNFKDVNGDELTTVGKTIGNHTAKETVILKGNGNSAYATINPPDGEVFTTVNGGVQVAVEVKAIENGYTVAFYDGNAVSSHSYKYEDIEDDDGKTKKIKTGQIDANAVPVNFVGNVGGDSLNITGTDKCSWAGTDKNQQKMGFYAAVYPTKTLVGSIQLPFILNEDEVVEWED